MAAAGGSGDVALAQLLASSVEDGRFTVTLEEPTKLARGGQGEGVACRARAGGRGGGLRVGALGGLRACSGGAW